MAKKKKTMQLGRATLTPLPGGKIRIALAGSTTDVAYKDLWGVTFVLGDADHQAEMIPAQKTQMMVFSRKHQIQASKDIQKGELVNVWCEVNIPLTIVEAIAEENGAKVIVKGMESHAEGGGHVAAGTHTDKKDD